jgi:hypothetical protein
VLALPELVFQLLSFFIEVSGYVSDFIQSGLWAFVSGKDGWTYHVKLAGDFVQTAGTFLQYTGKKFAIFNDHCILTCEVNRQLKNATDSNLNVSASNAVVITWGGA